MDSVAFLQQRQADWLDSLALIERAERTRLRGFSKDEIDELVTRYRRLVADLALAQARFPDSIVTRDLNDLVARGHGAVYRRPRARLRDAGTFLARDFPRTVRHHWRYVAVATLLFFVPALVSYAAGRARPDLARSVMPEGIIEAAEAGELHTDDILSVMPSSVMSSQIMTNNIGVIFAAFAVGITAGLGTLYILVFNGLFIGVIIAYYTNHHLGFELWGFLMPHGVIEISAICISGAAGLLLGDALVAPGLLPRREALVRQGGDAIRIILGLIPVLVVAGLVEGFVSPGRLFGEWTKFSIGSFLGVVLWTWIALGGIGPDGKGAGGPDPELHREGEAAGTSPSPSPLGRG